MCRLSAWTSMSLIGSFLWKTMFRSKIEIFFHDKITTEIFREWVLPHEFRFIDEKMQSRDDSEFLQRLEHFKDPFNFAP